MRSRVRRLSSTAESWSRADLCGQSLLYTPDVGANRADAVAAKLGVLNTDTQTESYPVDIEAANADAILLGHDVAVDCRGGASVEEACRSAGVALVAAEGEPRARRTEGGGAGARMLAAAAEVAEESNGLRGLSAIARVARELREDVSAARDRDPAARAAGTAEILLTYPGVHAILAHRISHALHQADVPLVPRLLCRTRAAS